MSWGANGCPGGTNVLHLQQPTRRRRQQRFNQQFAEYQAGDLRGRAGNLTPPMTPQPLQATTTLYAASIHAPAIRTQACPSSTQLNPTRPGPNPTHRPTPKTEFIMLKEWRTELSMGPFCVTRSNPTHYKWKKFGPNATQPNTTNKFNCLMQPNLF